MEFHRNQPYTSAAESTDFDVREARKTRTQVIQIVWFRGRPHASPRRSRYNLDSRDGIFSDRGKLRSVQQALARR